jgi:protoporphyrinogen oxidase
MTVYILGGGPTGLAVAHGLSQQTVLDFVLIEKHDQLGGLAKTVFWNGIGHHDFGPHKIFSTDLQLADRVRDILPNALWLEHKKSSKIYMHGRYLPYPPSPLSMIRVFDPLTFAKMVFGYGYAIIRSSWSRKKPVSFEEDLRIRVGAPLYKALFEPIARKLWGQPEELDVKLSKTRVQTPSLYEFIGQMLRTTKRGGFQAKTFHYPAGGLQTLWKAIQEKTISQGSFLLNHSVQSIRLEDNSVTSIDCVDITGNHTRYSLNADDFVVSTIPLHSTISLFNKELPDHISHLSEEFLLLNDLILVFFYLTQDKVLDDSWIFVPDPNISFHRISEQRAFDPGMIPAGTVVCCEIMSNKLRQINNMDDEQILSLALTDLNKMGFERLAPKASKVVRLPQSYPVFRPGIEQALDEILQTFDRYANFRTIGRAGAFNYIGTLDAMDIGYGFVDWLAPTRRAWKRERRRTNFYPVLD